MEKADKLDRLPPIAPAFRNYDYNYPRSLVLYLQCAPHTVVLAAFQADCESRDISWCSSRAQELAVEWFLQHPVARKYPPRRRMLRALLKAYITSIEEQHVADRVHSSVSSSDDPVQLELMEAYIELSVSGGDETRDKDMCFKTFFNPYVGGPDSPPMYACNAPVPAPPAPATIAPSLVHLTAFNSSPSQLTAHPGGGLKSPPPTTEPHVTGASLRGPRSMSEPTHPMAPMRVSRDGDGEDALRPMTSVRTRSPTTPPRSPFSGTTPPAANAVAAAASVEKVLEQFCAIRVSAEQFSNVGLSLWPAAFVMVQLLAQEFKGQSHLLSDLLGLPRSANAVLGANSGSMPPLAAPHRLHMSPTPTPPTSPPGTGRGKRGNVGTTTATSGSPSSSSSAKPYSSQLRILELGAGVGLTPIFLHHMEEYRQHVANFFATDYQESIIDNIKFNFEENGIHPVEDFTAAKRGLEGNQTPPFHKAGILDWTQHLENEGMFMENSADVTLAADCIYDVDVIPGLVDTIRLALTSDDISSYLTANSRPPLGRFDLGGSLSASTPGGNSSNNSSTTSMPSGGAPQKQRCCIVVQTHRQNSTMQTFFSAVRKFGQVRSYTLVRQPIGSLRVSQDGSGVDGGCVPLGDWDKQSALVNPDRIVCALRPDVVLEDGSLRSAAHRSAKSNHHSSSSGNANLINTHGLLGSSGSMPVGSSPGAAGGRTHSKSPYAPTPHNVPPTANAGRDGGPAFTPLHSIRSTGSGDSRTSFSRNSSAAVMEAAESLLADEMIGPFYTTMVGLIGVHIITLKPTRKVTR